MRIDARDNLAIELEHEPQDTMSRGMLRAKIERKITDGVSLIVRCQSSFIIFPWPFHRPATHSVAPSHGDRKSKSRNSWMRSTGS